jgi:hypothetical protein
MILKIDKKILPEKGPAANKEKPPRVCRGTQEGLRRVERRIGNSLSTTKLMPFSEMSISFFGVME